MDDGLSNGLGNNLSNNLGDNASESEPTTQSDIVSMWKMMEEPREMLNNAIQQHTQRCPQNAELTEANREYRTESRCPDAMKMKMFHMTHLEHCYTGAKDPDIFLDTSWCNFELHRHLYPHRYPDKVK